MVREQIEGFMNGLMKMSLAGVIMLLLTVFKGFEYTLTIGDTTVDFGIIVTILIAFTPVLLLISALRDMGVL